MEEKFIDRLKNNFKERYNEYLVFTLSLCSFILGIVSSLNSKIAMFVVSLFILSVSVFWLVVTIKFLSKKLIKDKFMVSLLNISLVLIALSLSLSFIISKVIIDGMFIIGVLILEAYLIGVIINGCFKRTKNIVSLVVFTIVVIVIGFAIIYLCTYNMKDKTLFNALITLFASLIGGSVTLAGVAWSINQNKEDKKLEEIQKAMPYFTFNILLNAPSNVDGCKACFPESQELGYDFEAYGELENSNHSVVILKRIYHDKKWFKLECNNTLLHRSKLIISFRFSNPNDILLEVSDTLGNLYYYKLYVLNIGLINGNINSIHTIRGLEKTNYKDKQN